MSNEKRIDEALSILISLGMPSEQQNNRTAMCLLAILNVDQDKEWNQADNQLIGIRGILDFIRNRLGIQYAENTRETIRDESVKPMISAGLLLKNPDDPSRSTNSPATVYQIAPEALELVREFNSLRWTSTLKNFLSNHQTLIERYAHIREKQYLSLNIDQGNEVKISRGSHSTLIKQILEEFVPRFAPHTLTIYVGDTGKKWGIFKKQMFLDLNINISEHGQMPDVVLYDKNNNWLFLIESVTSNGPIDSRRYEELLGLFSNGKAELIFVTAFPNRRIMRKYLNVMAWETDVWVADTPDHLIHFNGNKFFCPR